MKDRDKWGRWQGHSHGQIIQCGDIFSMDNENDDDDDDDGDGEVSLPWWPSMAIKVVDSHFQDCNLQQLDKVNGSETSEEQVKLCQRDIA